MKQIYKAKTLGGSSTIIVIDPEEYKHMTLSDAKKSIKQKYGLSSLRFARYL